MCWVDLGSIRTIRKIRDIFGIDNFVETGTFMGINARVHSSDFKNVYSCEINPNFFDKATNRCRDKPNVFISNQDSKDFLKRFKGKQMFYLDAHFYNPNGPRWVVKDELKAIGRNTECVIIIHDFDNGLGHCIYDGERLGLNVVGNLLRKVNPNFHYYTNRLEDCDIMTPDMATDAVMRDNLEYAHKTPRLTYRGILYAVPKKLPEGFNLAKWR